MHQYKPVAQTLLVLSILNLVFASPVVLREVRDTGNDVVVVAEDVTTVSERRRGAFPPEGPGSASVNSLDPSSGSMSSSHLLATVGQMPVQDSTTETSTFAHPLSAAHGAAPVPDSTTEATTSAHPLSAANAPAPVPDSTTQASTSSHQPVPAQGSAAEGRPPSRYTAVTYDMLQKDKKFYEKTSVRRIAGLTLLGVTTIAVVLMSALHKDHNNKDP